MKKRIITKAAVKQVLYDYWLQYRKHLGQTIFALLLPAIGNVLVFFVPPLFVGQIVNMLARSSGVAPFSSYAWLIIAFAASWIVGEMFNRIGFHSLNKLETEGLNELGKISFERLSKCDYDFYTNNFVGTLTKSATMFSRGFETFTDTVSYNILNNVFAIAFAVIILWRFSALIPLVLLACIAVAAAIAVPLVRRRSSIVAERHEASSKLAGRLSDTITNIQAVKAFAREETEGREFARYVDGYTTKFKEAFDFQNLRFDMAMSPVFVATNTIGLIAAVFFAHTLGLQAGTILVVFSYYSSISRTFWSFNNIYRNIESGIGEAAEFTQMFLDPPAVEDAKGATELAVTDPVIRFNDVGFAYDAERENRERFLNDFNLEIKSNQKVGLVGPSGGGKTTLTKLLLRFIDLESGAITIDGQDVSKVTQKSLREAIAYVPQDPLLFHRSLAENIAYGDEHATMDDIKRAARLARADEFIERLPHGYETLVGERGIKLSGGQRQRVAIARAILKKSSILVLDEATSSLDSESEKYIQEGLWELMKNKTAMVIAHRLSTIKHLDRILVLDQGKIVQDGTHEELIKQKDGLYAKLWSHQSGGFLEA